MNTWQEQVRAWHKASLTAIRQMEDLDGALRLDPGSPLWDCIIDLVQGWKRQLQREHDLGSWLNYWAWDCDFGREPYLIADDECRVQLCDGSRWPLDSIDNFIAMLERQQQIDEGSAQ